MKSIHRIFISLLVVPLLAACAGTDFVRMRDDSLELGKTTYQSVQDRMGSSGKEGVVSINGKQYKTLNYTFASVGGEALHSDVTPARGQTFYFMDRILVGHEFLSSFKSDNTDFDDGKVSSIKKGISTRADVLSLLGTPAGQFIYPIAKNRDGEILLYLYSETSGSAFNMKMYLKRLAIELDAQGKVVEVNFSEVRPS